MRLFSVAVLFCLCGSLEAQRQFETDFSLSANPWSVGTIDYIGVSKRQHQHLVLSNTDTKASSSFLANLNLNSNYEYKFGCELSPVQITSPVSLIVGRGKAGQIEIQIWPDGNIIAQTSKSQKQSKIDFKGALKSIELKKKSGQNIISINETEVLSVPQVTWKGQLCGLTVSGIQKIEVTKFYWFGETLPSLQIDPEFESIEFEPSILSDQYYHELAPVQKSEILFFNRTNHPDNLQDDSTLFECIWKGTRRGKLQITEPTLSAKLNFAEVNSMLPGDYPKDQLWTWHHGYRTNNEVILKKWDVATLNLIDQYTLPETKDCIGTLSFFLSGETLYGSAEFTSPPGYGGKDIWTFNLRGQHYVLSGNLGPLVNGIRDEFTPSLVKNTLYFSSQSWSGYGDADLYSYDLNKSSSPQNLGPSVNSSAWDGWLGYQDGQWSKSSADLLIGQKDLWFGNAVEQEKKMSSPVDIQNTELPFSNGKVILHEVTFAKGESKLLTSSYTQLNKVSSYLKENLNTSLLIVGHTDNVGDPVKNLVLSEKRAKSVFNYLIGTGIDQTRLDVDGQGGLQPIASNKVEETRKLNRRVELKILE